MIPAAAINLEVLWRARKDTLEGKLRNLDSSSSKYWEDRINLEAKIAELSECINEFRKAMLQE